jgi:hypothetical protein
VVNIDSWTLLARAFTGIQRQAAQVLHTVAFQIGLHCSIGQGKLA